MFSQYDSKKNRQSAFFLGQNPFYPDLILKVLSLILWQFALILILFEESDFGGQCFKSDVVLCCLLVQPHSVYAALNYLSIAFCP